MPKRLTIQKDGERVIRMQCDGDQWRIAMQQSSPLVFWFWHRSASGAISEEFLSTVETERKILAIVTERLKLSDFWNGQLRLFPE